MPVLGWARGFPAGTLAEGVRQAETLPMSKSGG
jgi:hypothetical protein